eukprot:3682510-Rhodomonas_salina.4
MARLRPIYVNPSMTEFKGTSEGVIIAKWHTLSVHINQHYLRQVALRIEGMEELTRVRTTVPAPVCEACQHGKSKLEHNALPKKTLKQSTEPLHCMHADMSGHVRVPTVDGAHYFLLVLDDATGYKFVALLRMKDEYIDALNHLLIPLGKSMKILHIDNTGEMTSARAFEFYEAHRIWIEVCNAYEHHQSGRIESAIGSVSMRARVMLVSSGVPLTFWGFTVRYAVAIDKSRGELHFSITAEELSLAKVRQGATYELLNKKRNEWYGSETYLRLQAVESVKRSPNESSDFLASLLHRQDPGHLIKQTMKLRNEHRKSRGNICKLMCLCDATASMQDLWKHSSSKIQEVLKRIAEIAKGKGHLELNWV